MADILNIPLLLAAFQNENERIEHNRRKKTLRGSADPLELPDNIFKGIYRCNKNTARYLIEEISPFLPQLEREELCIPKSEIILCALHFFAQGTYQKSTGQDMNCPMSQSSVSRCIELVTNVLNDYFGQKVHFPQTQEEKNEEKLKFFNNLNSFPGIIGLVDGTHIKIQAPPTNDPDFPGILFYNRKGFYSLNVQIICSADYKILAINSRYPGSVHDSAVWSTSLPRLHLMQCFQNGDRASWLLGDSGYPLEPWLITPIVTNNLTEPERRFNILFRSIRNIVERVIGILKTRFRCCFGHRALHYSPPKAAKIVNACAILHNIFIERRDFIEEEEENENEPAEALNIDDLDLAHNYFNEGVNTRNRIIQDYF